MFSNLKTIMKKRVIAPRSTRACRNFSSSFPLLSDYKGNFSLSLQANTQQQFQQQQQNQVQQQSNPQMQQLNQQNMQQNPQQLLLNQQQQQQQKPYQMQNMPFSNMQNQQSVAALLSNMAKNSQVFCTCFLKNSYFLLLNFSKFECLALSYILLI